MGRTFHRNFRYRSKVQGTIQLKNPRCHPCSNGFPIRGNLFHRKRHSIEASKRTGRFNSFPIDKFQKRDSTLSTLNRRLINPFNYIHQIVISSESINLRLFLSPCKLKKRISKGGGILRFKTCSPIYFLGRKKNREENPFFS